MKQAEFFDSIANEWDNIIEVNEEKINTLLSKTNIKDGDSILDVGTGTGVLIPFYKKLNPNGKIKGVDISQGMLDIANQKFGNLENISFEKIDIEENKVNSQYDKVVLYSMFPHLKNKVMTIKSLVDYSLKHNGKLIIAHSNSREFLNNMHKEKDEIVKEDRLIPVLEQKEIFEKAGVNVIEAFENNEIYYLVIRN